MPTVKNFQTDSNMNSSVNFRVILNLSNYFCDHRCSARIFINNTIQTIADVKKRIRTIFNIKHFYLTSQNQYLPSVEDVRVLQDNDIVWVMKKHSRELCKKCDSPKQKFNKKNHVDINQTEGEIVIPTSTEQENDRKKNKKKRKCAVQTNVDVENPPNKKKQKIVNKNSSNLLEEFRPPGDTSYLNIPLNPAYTKNTEIKPITDSYLQNKQINIVKIEVVNPDSQNAPEEKNDSVAQLSDLSEYFHSTPSREQENIQNSGNKKIHNALESLCKTVSNLSDRSRNFGIKCLTPTVNNKQPNIELINGKQNIPNSNTGKPNYTEKLLDTDFNEVTENSVNKQNLNEQQPIDINVYSNESKTVKSLHEDKNSSSIIAENSIPVNIISDISTSKLDNKNLLNQNLDVDNVSNNGSIITIRDSVDSKNSLPTFPINKSETCLFKWKQETNLSSTQEKLSTNNSLEIDASPKTDVTESNNDESDANSFVTKRRRHRVRKRKQKNKINVGSTDESIVASNCPVFTKPFKTVACPLIHIKFGDVDEKNVSIEDCSNGNVAVVNDTSENNNESNGAVLKLSETFLMKEENLKKQPSMVNIEPRIGDYISFKILRITENYTPELSSFITGKVINYDSKEKNVIFDIIYGLDMCRLPTGKLSLDTEENEEFKNQQEFKWSDLIDPKLLFP